MEMAVGKVCEGKMERSKEVEQRASVPWRLSLPWAAPWRPTRPHSRHKRWKGPHNRPGGAEKSKTSSEFERKWNFES